MDVPIRIGPSEGSYVLGLLPAGTVVTVFAREQNGFSPPRKPVIAIPGLGFTSYDPAVISLNGPISSNLSEFRAFGSGKLSPSYPLSVRTGNPAVDRVLDVVERHDVPALQVLADKSKWPCIERAVGVSTGPICPAGVADGTFVPGFAVGSCHGEIVPVNQAFESFQFPRDLGVFAVTRRNDSRVGLVMTLVLTANTAGGRSSFGWTLREDGAISGLVGACGSLDAHLEDAQDFILPPLKPSQLR